MIPGLQTPPARLCILRLSAVGDVTHVLPVLRTLQAAWPDTRITWIVGRLEHGLVGDIPGVDFVIFEKAAGRAAHRRLGAALAGRRFDVLLAMQVSLRASLASRCVRAPIRIGFDLPRARDFQWVFTNHRIARKPRQHVLDAFFGFVEALGLQRGPLRWDLPIPAEARAFARGELPGDVPTLVINACSTLRRRNWRNWSEEGYAAVADYAARRHGMRVLLTGGPAPSELLSAERIRRLCACEPVNLVGKTSLKELAAVLERATVVVAPDTGPAHIANAVGTPVVGLFATSNPLRTGPYGGERWWVNKYPDALEAEYGLTVEEARWGRRVRCPAAMDRILVSDVTDRVDAVLSRHPWRPAPGHGSGPTSAPRADSVHRLDRGAGRCRR